MSQLLPGGVFSWVDPSQFTSDNINSYANCDNEGYLSEVDVKYSEELHDLHNDLLFMCERIKINDFEKLVPNLNDKKNYVIHIKVLNQALKQGLILEKVHRVVEFNQSAWLKPYIDFNTQLLELRQRTTLRKILQTYEYLSLRKDHGEHWEA